MGIGSAYGFGSFGSLTARLPVYLFIYMTMTDEGSNQ